METSPEHPDQLTYQGKVYLVSEWLTQTHYAAKWGLTTRTVWAMIERELIEPANVLFVEEWGLKLVRDVAPPVTKRGPNPKAKA